MSYLLAFLFLVMPHPHWNEDEIPDELKRVVDDRPALWDPMWPDRQESSLGSFALGG